MRNALKSLFIVILMVLSAHSMAQDFTFSSSTLPAGWSATDKGSSKFSDDTPVLKIPTGNTLTYTFDAATNLTSIDFVYSFGSKTAGIYVTLTAKGANGNTIGTAQLTQETQQSGSNVRQEKNLPFAFNGVKSIEISNESGKNFLLNYVKFYTSTTTTTVSVTGVSLNKTTTSIEVGASETLTATITPSNATNQNVSWTSDDTGVATVNNGVVTGVGTGTANITATTADGNMTATCVVTVTAAVLVSVTSISLDKASASIKVGATETLTVSYTPSNANTGKSITWTSDKPAVATVNNGIVTGVAIGTATITATSEGGSTATCAVTVTAADPVPSTNLTLHVPEVYEAKENAGGYEGTLTVYQNNEYEVYYTGKTKTESGTSVGGVAIELGSDGKATNFISTFNDGDIDANDGWFKGGCNSPDESTSSSAMAQFPGYGGSWKMYGKKLQLHISGYNQFSILAKDKKKDATDKRHFEVTIDGNVVSKTSDYSTDVSVRNYSISTGEHVIEVEATGTEASQLYAFSLRVPQEPKTKWLKGNDSTQTVLQTTTIKPVTYVTKYNNIQGAETKLEWLGAEATGIELKKKEGSLTDTLTLSGKANCPVGDYAYAVVAYYNGVETTRAEGKFFVKSDIKTLSYSNDAKVFTGEEMDPIQFQYYALDATDVKLTWDQTPAGIVGKGTTAGKYEIGGTPTTKGTYKYSITVTGADTVIKGTIDVDEAIYGENSVLYLYKNDFAYEKDGMYNYLKSQGKNLIERKAKEDKVNYLRDADQYAKYKWLLISEDVDADNPEVLAAARGEINLPVLNMKSFTYTPGRLNWGDPDNGSLTDNGKYITVYRADHPIFKKLNAKKGDRIQVLAEIDRKGLMPIDVNYGNSLCLATALTRDIEDYYGDGDTVAFLHEIPAGLRTNKQKYICLPISMTGSNKLHAEGKKLIDEVINYLTSPTPASIYAPSLVIDEFWIDSYKGEIDEATGRITVNVLQKDSDAMKAAKPTIVLASPLTFYTPEKQYVNADGTIDFSNWHYGVKYVISDYASKHYYTVVVNLYNPEGIENIEVGTWVNIYDIYGRKVTTTNEDLRTMTLPHGMYIVVTEDGQTIKIMK